MWMCFERVTDQYISICEKDPRLSVDKLYGFLDGRVETLSIEERKTEIENMKKEFIQA